MPCGLETARVRRLGAKAKRGETNEVDTFEGIEMQT